ncbi:aminoglycoside 6-adenylyltransferase [Sporosarcina cyprini]|uniref:aminoglycoside 6-adenylyltransferase n=1 Tax=Sporosarcina cyprini TaxID=2910523 RepID=UPI001EE0CF48|nr:aminoglycoside 6-adenylyltransferase [Sporosarcina cyprini]MCG3086484.1 aminoglycoside 6-adenylyltransferase [Sporosarcina cyprini]
MGKSLANWGERRMYTFEERKTYFDNVSRALASSELVEGVVQLGSGVIGYKDEFSDIDLMIAVSNIEDAERTKDFIRDTLEVFNPLYFKEKQFSKDIFLIIAILENGLEFNVSIVPRVLLSVQSPLWKVIIDKTGLVKEKMDAENEHFLNRPVKYNVGMDVPFEFVYCSLALEKELKRNNMIYALKMLEDMRGFTLLVQAMIEDKKLHQFKAYETLDPHFLQDYLATVPTEVTAENIRESACKLKELFMRVIKHSTTFSMDDELKKLLDKNESLDL